MKPNNSSRKNHRSATVADRLNSPIETLRLELFSSNQIFDNFRKSHMNQGQCMENSSPMKEFKTMLRENSFFARGVTFGMIPLFWRLGIGLGRWLEYDKFNIMLLGISGIWIRVAVGHNLYYKWLFPEKK